jgi:hypothetical protein
MARFAISALAIGASLLLFGCAATRPAPEGKQPPPAPIPGTLAPELPPAPAPANTPAPAGAPATAAAQPPPTSSATKASAAATSSRPASKPGDTAAAAAKPTPAPKPAAKPTAPEAPSAQTLDLGSLEQRLKDTKAIGVFTKLSLKNQVDDLLGELRAFHNGSGKTPTAVLRQKYDTLMLKVLTLLQDGDPQLASAIASSREALWGILMDPKKFAQI